MQIIGLSKPYMTCTQLHSICYNNITAQNQDHIAHFDLLPTLVLSHDFKMQNNDASKKLKSQLQSIVFGPIQNTDIFTFAVAALLADLLHGGSGFDKPDHGWGLLLEPMSSIPQPRNAAIMRGFDRVFRLNNKEDANPVPKYDCTTLAISHVCQSLSKLAKNVTPAELTNISSSNYGKDTDNHYAALKKVIFDQKWLYSKGSKLVPERSRGANRAYAQQFRLCHLHCFVAPQ